jgi:hypothetical protein
MSSVRFREDMEKGARRNGLALSREEAIVSAVAPASEESFINIYGGSPNRDREITDSHLFGDLLLAARSAQRQDQMDGEA